MSSCEAIQNQRKAREEALVSGRAVSVDSHTVWADDPKGPCHPECACQLAPEPPTPEQQKFVAQCKAEYDADPVAYSAKVEESHRAAEPVEMALRRRP